MPSQAQRRARAKAMAAFEPPGGMKNFKAYAARLFAQPEKNICPQCYANGSRKRCCKNMVMLGDLLVCCWLGDRDEISEAEFQAKVQEVQSGAESAQEFNVVD